ncbi:Leucine-rich repeat-containing protein 57 [Amphibalanus amphitrite]|uniref:Leucine-rich repeat-containing protein 57 n=1 Tax=Amphibalanus amphitrite TaxID=1232801 RepID=A0A6A4WYU7_AMPAM|nr:Leucine-rich repeat-containing protein 57 [Amphibalanus amphitrite]
MVSEITKRVIKMGNANSLKHHLENAQKTGVCALPKRGLSEVPADLLKVAASLRTLDLSENKLSSLPSSMQAFPQLKHLNCSQNKLTQLPDTLGALTKLETLLMSYNKITKLPDMLSALKNLKTVNLRYARRHEPQLERLGDINNMVEQVNEFGDVLCDCKKGCLRVLAGGAATLRSLCWRHNQLSELPGCLLSLPQLDVLDLSSNLITSVPASAAALRCSELNLNDNQINRVSAELADCERLKILRLESNCLSLDEFPARLLADSHVSLLALDGNVFEVKQLAELDGYDKYMERYTATKKKMF